MEKNLFIELFYQNQLHQTLENYFYNDLRKLFPITAPEVAVPVIDDFFKLNFEHLSYSPEELLSSLNHINTNTMYKILFSNELDFWDKRFSYIKKFEVPLCNDLAFFHKAFITFLDNKEREPQFQHYKYRLTDNELKSLNAKDNDILKYLISIGKENNHFTKFAEKDLYTLNNSFSSIISQSEIYQKDFSFDKLLHVLLYSKGSPDKRAFFATYYQEILSVFEKHPEFISSLNDNKVTSVFLESLLYNYSLFQSTENKNKLIHLIDLLKEHPDSFKIMLDKKAIRDQILTYMPELIIPFFEKIYSTDKKKIMDFPLQDTNFDNYSLKLFDFIMAPFNNSVDFFKPIPEETFDIIFNALRNELPKDVHVNTYIGKYMLRYLPFLIEYERKYSTDYTQSNSIIKKYSNEISSSLVFNQSEKNFIEDMKAFQFFLDISGHLPEIESLTNKVILFLQDHIYSYFLENKNSSSYIIKSYIHNLCYLLDNKPDMQDVLNKLHDHSENPLWSNIHFSYKEKTAGKYKNYVDMPLSFCLISNTDGKVLPWFTEKDKISIFSNIKFRDKSYIRSFTDKKWFIKSVLKLSANKNSFNTLVNKAGINFLEKIPFFTTDDKENLKTVLSYYKLDTTIKTTTPVKAKKSLKI